MIPRAALAAVALLLATPMGAAAHGQGGGPPPTDLVGILLAWHLDLPIILGILAAGAAYLYAVTSVNRAHRSNPWPRRRTAAFVLALLGLALALLSPLDTLADDLLTVHVVQHMFLVAIAAPLLAASGIGTLALRAASDDTRRRYLLPILHSRVVSALTYPVVGWVAFAGVMWGSHLTSLYNAALLDDGLHAIEHMLYLSAAALFWWPMLSPDPLRWRIAPGPKLVALLAQLPAMSFLAVIIVMASTPLYAAYLGRTDAFGIDALADQRIAGSLMWVLGDLSLLIPFAWLLVVFMRHEDAEAKRVDARLARERRITSPKESS